MRLRSACPRLVRSTGIAILLLLVALPALAQVPAGTVQGMAKDALGRPLDGARVRIETPDGRVAGSVTVPASGAYRFTGLAPGVYSVIAEKDGFDAASAIATVAPNAGAAADLALPARQALDITITAQRLEAARASIQPRIGASTYTLTNQAIQAQPGGDNLPLNQTLLQAPGVAQDSFGQVHVRNDHGNLQYRINGVILPEGVTLFGQSLSSRFASSVDLITGALPAQYGLRTAGIIDIQTKSGAFEPGGSVGLYGGSHSWLEPSAEYGGHIGGFNYFLSGDYLQNGLGIESPTASRHPLHDDTQQGHGFAYLEDIIDPTSKVAAILGTYRGQFQIPNRPGQTPSFTVNGLSDFDSSLLDENQKELNHYGILSYLKTSERFDFQIAGFTRYSSLSFEPDVLGDLMFNGIAQNAYRRSIANGLQMEGTYRLATDHTLRSGVIVSEERVTIRTLSTVLPALAGAQTSDSPFSFLDTTNKTAASYSVYLQDEYRVLPTVTINFGGRFDAVSAFRNESQLSPRLNVVWKATPSTSVHAGYARYFTPPPTELVATASLGKLIGTTAEPAVLINDKAKAERSHYFDVGVDQDVLPGLKVGIDVYYKIARNLIDEGQFGAPVILTAFNYQSAHNKGVELTTSYVNGPFTFYGNLALAEQKAEHIISSEFNFSPDDLNFISSNFIHTDHDQFMTASAGVSYLWQGTRFSADILAATGLRSGANGLPNGSSLPSYEQVNLGVSHMFEIPRAGRLEARFDVINLLDEVYLIRDGSGVGVGAPQFGPRRAFLGGLRKEF
jgi:outer membrane receptor protein involved in Fe transport